MEDFYQWGTEKCGILIKMPNSRTMLGSWIWIRARRFLCLQAQVGCELFLLSSTPEYRILPTLRPCAIHTSYYQFGAFHLLHCAPIMQSFDVVKPVKCYPGGRKTDLNPSTSEILLQTSVCLSACLSASLSRCV